MIGIYYIKRLKEDNAIMDNIFIHCFSNEEIKKVLELNVNKEYDLNDTFNDSFLSSLVNYSGQIGTKCYCEKCKDEETFIIDRHDFINSAYNFIESIYMKQKAGDKEVQHSKIVSLIDEHKKFGLDLTCPFCQSTLHLYYVYNDSQIEKIATFPDVMGGYKAKYKVLRKLKNNTNLFDYYNEFIEACYSYYKIKSGIGAFCYLRRCLENFVKDTWNDMYLEGKITESYDSKKKFSYRIDNIRINIDNDIYNMMPNLYDILSKGIHELDEEECLKYYEIIKEIVFTLLINRIELIDKKKKIVSLKANLEKIHSNIK